MPLTPEQTAEIDAARATPRQTLRAVSEGIEAHLYHAHPVLDHGFIRVIDYMGDDAAIVQAARVSYGAGTRHVQNDELLLFFLDVAVTNHGEPCLNTLPNPRMDDAFERPQTFLARLARAEDESGERPPPNAAAGVEDVGTEPLHNRTDDRGVVEHLVGQRVGVDDGGTAIGEHPRHGRFPRTDPAHQPDDDHGHSHSAHVSPACTETSIGTESVSADCISSTTSRSTSATSSAGASSSSSS